MRELKFRIWLGKEKSFSKPFDLAKLLEDDEYHCFDKDCVLEQFTGLKDNTGREIYEGDILKRHSIVLDSNFGGSIDTVCFSNGYFFAGENFLMDHNEQQEIVGNIHQNQDLIEKQI